MFDIEITVGSLRFFIRSLTGRGRDWIRETYSGAYDVGNSVMCGFQREFLQEIKYKMDEAKMRYKE